MRLIYTALFYAALPLVLLRLYWRGRKAPAYRRRWRERFGFIEPIESGCLWLHAVSLGETRAALPLIKALQERFPRQAILVTTMTPTGSQQVRDSFGNSVHHVYLPYDLPDAVARFLLRCRPKLGIIMETELWPNLFHACSAAGIPLLIANARLSQRSAKGYAQVAGLTWETLNCVTLIAAQTRADTQRFVALGMPTERIKVTGNIKYDLPLPSGLLEQGRMLRQQLFPKRTILIAASTHRGEDEPVLVAFRQLQNQFPQLLLLLVPRHPERFDEVAELCRRNGLNVVRRSEAQPCGQEIAIFLGDSMGELLLFYAAADMAFVGGSLVPIGGHNVLEPALLGLPVLFGPHMFNFTEAAAHLLSANGARQIDDTQTLAEKARELLSDASLRAAMGRRAKLAVEANQGALARLFDCIEKLLKTPEMSGTVSRRRHHPRRNMGTSDAE